MGLAGMARGTPSRAWRRALRLDADRRGSTSSGGTAPWSLDVNIGNHLNAIIRHCLFEPRGDPDWSQCAAAARAFLCLKSLGLPVDSEADVDKTLRKENVSEEDFLALVEESSED